MIFLFNLPGYFPGERWVLMSYPLNRPRMVAKLAIKEHFKGSELPYQIEIHIRVHSKRSTKSPKTSRFKITNHESGEQSIENIDVPIKRPAPRTGPRRLGAY